MCQKILNHTVINIIYTKIKKIKYKLLNTLNNQLTIILL